jgi:hypothetical protein
VVQAHGGTASIDGAIVRLRFPAAFHLDLSGVHDPAVESRNGG